VSGKAKRDASQKKLDEAIKFLKEQEEFEMHPI
jgi:hypothetical protein